MQNASKSPKPLSQWPDLVAKLSRVIDLEASAPAIGSLIRKRESRSAEMPLRLLLARGPGGLSLRAAAVWTGVTGLADMSDTAVMKRGRNAATWLGQIAGALLRRDGAPRPAAAILPGRRLRIVEGSVITQPGTHGTD
jgi:hypothetical protein